MNVCMCLVYILTLKTMMHPYINDFLCYALLGSKKYKVFVALEELMEISNHFQYNFSEKFITTKVI